MPWTRLTLVRHGHTVGNGAGLHVPMSGSTDVPLGPQGLREAQVLAARLAREGPFVAIYSSPLARAHTTARTIAERCSLLVRLDPALAEIDCGEADGHTLADVQARYPDHWSRNLEQLDPDFRWPGGESYRELRERSLGAVHRIAAAHAGERLIVVTHSGVIGQIMGSVHGISAACWEKFRPRTGSISEIAVHGDRIEVHRFDELPLPSSAPGEACA